MPTPALFHLPIYYWLHTVLIALQIILRIWYTPARQFCLGMRGQAPEQPTRSTGTGLKSKFFEALEWSKFSSILLLKFLSLLLKKSLQYHNYSFWVKAKQKKGFKFSYNFNFRWSVNMNLLIMYEIETKFSHHVGNLDCKN